MGMDIWLGICTTVSFLMLINMYNMLQNSNKHIDRLESQLSSLNAKLFEIHHDIKESRE